MKKWQLLAQEIRAEVLGHDVCLKEGFLTFCTLHSDIETLLGAFEDEHSV